MISVSPSRCCKLCPCIRLAHVSISDAQIPRHLCLSCCANRSDILTWAACQMADSKVTRADSGKAHLLTDSCMTDGMSRLYFPSMDLQVTKEQRCACEVSLLGCTVAVDWSAKVCKRSFAMMFM